MMCAVKEWMQMGMLAFTAAYSSLQLQGRSPHSFQCFFFFIFILSLVKQNFKISFFCETIFDLLKMIARKGDDSFESSRGKLAFSCCYQVNHQNCHQTVSSSINLFFIFLGE